MKKILFMGSKSIGFECLKYLLENAEKLNCEVLGVLSNNRTLDNSTSIKYLADSYNIPLILELDSILELSEIDFIISVQYHLILKPKHIAKAKELAINLHMAPLPEFRGCNQFSFAIYNDSKTFGTTLHRLEPGVDNGAIIAERRFPILATENVESLYDKTYKHSLELFKDKVKDILEGNYKLVNQKELIEERGVGIYFRKDINRLKMIDLNQSAEEIIKKVRATAMPGFEPPLTEFNGEKYYIIPKNHYNKQI
jgi:methionyl-tRNA formyltransferase